VEPAQRWGIGLGYFLIEFQSVKLISTIHGKSMSRKIFGKKWPTAHRYSHVMPRDISGLLNIFFFTDEFHLC
jgi:hypothetical protein